MLKLLKSFIVGLMITGFYGCSVKTDDIQIVTFISDKANLKSFKTYQIRQGSCLLQNSEGYRVPDKMKLADEIHKMVESELANRGKAPVTENPDFFVVYAAIADVDAFKKDLNQAGREAIEEIPDSTMLLVLFDSNTGSVLWMSQAEGEVKDIPVDQIKKRLKYVIKKMFNGM